uniref:Cytochrome P450 n=1 Tax=Ascaris lumbricoides TaxID=6252 RepID=A0A0M3IV00_ASCLU
MAGDVAAAGDVQNGPTVNQQQKVSKASIEMSPWPSFLQDRVAYFEKLMARHRAEIAAKVWDLDRPFEGDATLQLLKFDDEEGKQVTNFYLLIQISTKPLIGYSV